MKRCVQFSRDRGSWSYRDGAIHVLWHRRVPTEVTPDDLSELLRTWMPRRVIFDLDNVLVVRYTSNEHDLLKLLELDYEKVFTEHVPLARKRRVAQHRVLGTDNGTASLSEVYDAIACLNDFQRLWALHRELELLHMLSAPRKGMAGVWSWCQAHGIDTAVAYGGLYPHDEILGILEECGYGKPSLLQDDATLSGLSRFRGEGEREDGILYVCSSLGRAWRARDGGTRCVLLRPLEDTPYHNKSLHRWADARAQAEYSIIRGFIANNMPASYGYFERLGYEAIGPILLGFSCWLNESLAVSGIQKVFFLSREGILLKRAYELTIAGNGTLPSELLRVSRLATTVPLLERCGSWGELLEALRVPRSGTEVGRILERLGIDAFEAETALKEVGVSPHEDGTAMGKRREQLVYESIRDALSMRAVDQRRAFESYLDTNGFQGRVAVVDVGWFGTIQSNLQKMRPHDDVFGYYLAWKPNVDGEPRPANERFFLFDSIYSDVGEKISSALEVFELCFLSTDGSVKFYEETSDGRVVPVLDEPEQRDEGAELVGGLQRAALQFVSDFAPLASRLGLHLPADACSAAYCAFIDPPSDEMIANFEQLNISDVGVASRSPFTKGSLLRYALHPRDFVDDLKGPGSKSVLLKTTFRLPLPWSRIMSLLRRLQRQGE